MTPLRGVRILVTRAVEDAEPLAQRLRGLGANVIHAPAIRFVPPADPSKLDAALRCLGDYDWNVFTSPHGVDLSLRRASELGIPWLRRCNMAAIGSATQAQLQRHGVSTVFTPAEFHTDALAATLPAKPGARVLILRARDGNPALAAKLRARLVLVDDVEAYATEPNHSLGQVLAMAQDPIDWVVFASPSTIHSFDAQIPSAARQWLQRARIACIGPVTARAARASGYAVHAEANPHTIDGLVQALLEAHAHA